jgi:DNA-binding Lrp family transcriptional regulator
MAFFDECYAEMVEIDDLDRQIVHCLTVDGRASFNEIAAVLGVSDQTVARRYRRMRGECVLRVVGLRTRRSVRSQGWVLHLRCVPGSGLALAEGLARRPDIAWVQLLSGDTEVVCTLRGSAADRDAVLAKLPRGGRIVAASAHQMLHVFASHGRGFLHVLPPEQVESLRQPVYESDLDIGELDLALFRELATDGRMSHADLAKAVGWSESTVRRRIDQLRESGMLCFDLEIDLAAFGFLAPVWLWLSVPPAELATTGKAFAGFPEVDYAKAVTGGFNLMVRAICRDEEALYEFLTCQVGSLRSVDRMETSPIIRTVKQSSPSLPIPIPAPAPA